jgi:ribosome recycling factor
MAGCITDDLNIKMDKVIADLKRSFGKIRTGRASLSILDDIIVPFYGIDNHINQLATLSIPESRVILIQPWDTNALSEIEKAILKSDLGITPNNDGKIIRLVMPALTEEKRKDMVKQIKKMAEDHKVAIRNVRQKSNDQVKKQLKDKMITEDESYKLLKDTQETTDRYEKMVNEIEQHKEKEIMEI